MQHLHRAFTLVELIVVIAIIAILAAGLLAGLDPMEQIAKSQDTSLEANLKELKSSIDRFIIANQRFPGQGAGLEQYPGQSGQSMPFSMLKTQIESPAELLDGNVSCTTCTGLRATSEIKESLIKTLKKDDDHVYIYPTASSGSNGDLVDSVTLCFRPKSKQFKQNAHYSGTVNGGRPVADDPACASGGPDNCYVCLE